MSIGDDTVRVWAWVRGACVATLEGHSVVFHPDGTRLASGSRDKTARVWEWGSGARVANVWRSYSVRSVAFHPTDGTRLASGSDDTTVRVVKLPPPPP